MAKQVIWTNNASQDLQQIIEYLKNDWPQAVCFEFVERIERKISILVLQPRLGRKTSKHSTFRRTLITPDNLLIYSVHKNHLIIHPLKDTWQSK